MRSTMQEGPLLISGILRHGASVYAESEVVTVEPGSYRTATFGELGERAERLASALRRLGIGPDDRVGTFMWNNQAHLEAYFAVPSMGSVLHTLNIRLFPEQLAYVINHAKDKVLIVDASLVPALARVIDTLPTVETIVVNGATDTSPLGETLDYETLVGAEEPGFEWPELEERDAAVMCYTSGTTGQPKGVVYSHRSTFLHSMAITSAASLGMTEHDKILVVVPMFHANAWGTPYAALMAGTSLVMPQMFLKGEDLVRIVAELRPTMSVGVPTIWNDFLRAAKSSDADLSSLRGVMAGGAAVPRALIEAFRDRVGVPITQGWGMTETTPVAAIANPPAKATEDEELDYRTKAGRVIAGVEVRVVGPDLEILPNDGESVGELEIRGPWITASYYQEHDPGRFHHGWLRTGDVGTLDARGFMQITDRSKDVVKSGGEWISSVQLENQVMAHPDVYEAAVVAVPDEKWQERPLVVVVAVPGTEPSAQELVEFLNGRVAHWWLPERWAFVKELPKTSVGKFDKKVLRADHSAGTLEVTEVEIPPEA